MDIPFNLLVLPFLGGYIFVRFWNYTRIHVLRSDKDRIVIRAALAGLFCLMAAFVISLVLDAIPCELYGFCYYSKWKALVPFEFAGVSFGAFLIGLVGWAPLNLYFTRAREVARAINEDGDPLEMLLKDAQDRGLSIAVTLTNEKIYIGFVINFINPATPTNHIALTPLRSGYRDPLTKRMYLRINYSRAIDLMNERLQVLDQEINRLMESIKRAEEKKKFRAVRRLGLKLMPLHEEWDELENVIDSFVVVIPVNQIGSVFVFDSNVYDRYFAVAGMTQEDTEIPAPIPAGRPGQIDA